MQMRARLGGRALVEGGVLQRRETGSRGAALQAPSLSFSCRNLCLWVVTLALSRARPQGVPLALELPGSS